MSTGEIYVYDNQNYAFMTPIDMGSNKEKGKVPKFAVVDVKQRPDSTVEGADQLYLLGVDEQSGTQAYLHLM